MYKHSIWVKSLIAGGLLLLPACANGEQQAAQPDSKQEQAAAKTASGKSSAGTAGTSKSEHAPILNDYDSLSRIPLNDEDRQKFSAYFFKTREAVKQLDAALAKMNEASNLPSQSDRDQIKKDFADVQAVFDANSAPSLNSLAIREELAELHEKIRSVAVYGQQLAEEGPEADSAAKTWRAEVDGRVEEALVRSRELLGQLEERSREGQTAANSEEQKSDPIQAEFNKLPSADQRKINDYMTQYGALSEELVPLGSRLGDAFAVLQSGESDADQMYEEWTSIHASFQAINGKFGKLSVPQVDSALLNETFSDMHKHTVAAFSYGEQGAALIMKALETGDQSKLDQAVTFFNRMSEEGAPLREVSKKFAGLLN